MNLINYILIKFLKNLFYYQQLLLTIKLLLKLLKLLSICKKIMMMQS